MDQRARTARALDRLYKSYFAGDAAGMVALLAYDAEVRFLGRGTYRGREEAGRFLTPNTASLLDLEFRIRTTLVDGVSAAVVWDETALTAEGAVYENHGVDVFVARGDELAALRVNNDITIHRSHFGSVDRASVLGGDIPLPPPPAELEPGSEPGAASVIPLVLEQLWDAIDGVRALPELLSDAETVWQPGAGREEAIDALAGLKGRQRRPVVVVANDDVAVAELAIDDADRQFPVTQVVHFAGGRITGLRTYLDPRDLDEGSA